MAVMPGPYVEEVANEFDYENEWFEDAGDNERGGAHFADTAQEDTLYGWVRWEKRRSALRFFKGWAEPWEAAGTWLLHREQPHAHPDYPWMRAFDTSFVGVKLSSNPERPDFAPHDVTPFTTDPVTRRTKYKWALCAVRYRAFSDMWFLADDQITAPEDEWHRNTLFLPPEPSVEALTVTGGLSQLTFSEGAGGAAPTAGTTKFGAPIAELLTKVGFRLLWQHVPWEFVSSSNNLFWPQKILDCVGRINSDTFLDEFDPETVRMTAPTFELFPWWVASDDQDEPLIGVNIYLNFEWFDPKTGIVPPFRKGWNTMPWGGDGRGANPGGDGKFYRATRDGTNVGRGMIEAVPFSGMFTSVENP